MGKAGTRKVERGESVLKVQQRLIELGFLAAGADTGTYNDETWAAVINFKKAKHLGWEAMGDVGPKTVGCLDHIFACPCPRPKFPASLDCSPLPPPGPSCCPDCGEPDNELPGRTLPTGPFLDLQIACVTDRGACTTATSVAAFDTECRGETGYAGTPLVIDDLVCGTPGLGIAQALDRAYPTWRSVIPDCPCTRAQAEAAPNFSPDRNPLLGEFHPGADTSFRSDPVESVPGTAHCQQCCYTERGMLITEGGGQGTPDVWSSTSSFSRHQRIDVRPFLEFGKDFRTYNRFWIPNHGSGCPAADPCINRCEQAFEACRHSAPQCLAARSHCLAGCA
jgi:hypothetical protein